MKIDRTALRRNLEEVSQRIRSACARSGRAPEDVRLVAVTKSVPVEVAAALFELGVLDLAESRPEVASERAAWFAARGLTARWHLIGHYQRRKVRRTAELFALVHGVDRIELCEALGAVPSPPPVLLQINVTGERSKQGFAPEELAAALEASASAGLDVRGLMTMAPYGAEPADLHAWFGRLRELARSHATPGRALDELSMGMSGDFEEAVEEGATLVRVGTRLFVGVTEES